MTGPEDSDPVPDRLRGVWQRTLLERPGGEPDRRSRVYWLQTASCHADLRQPPERPDFSRCTSIADCSPSQLRWLASQQGFAGFTVVSGDRCQWHRQTDFQPVTSARDLGTWSLSDDSNTLEEYGVDAPYHETWACLPTSRGASRGWQPKDPARDLAPLHWLLLCGRWFFYVRGRKTPLLSETLSLLDLLREHPDAAGSLLDMELSLGETWEPGTFPGPGSRAWVIRHSNLPWREGQTLSLAGAWEPLGDAWAG